MAKDPDKRLYEIMFLVDSSDAAQWDDLMGHLTNILTRHGAEIIGITRWDERRLAFPIAQRKRGTYVLGFFSLGEGGGISPIERDCRLSEKVLRALVLRADHYTVADMRMQLGEDIHEDVARALEAERDELAALAAVDASDATTEAAPREDPPAADA